MKGLTERVREMAREILAGTQPLPFGICRFEEVQPCLECRALSRIPPQAASVLVCLFPYYTGEQERNISRYAMVRDYHHVAGEYLERFCEALRQEFSEHRFEAFTDNSPIREVRAALCAGLGLRGRNGLVLHPTYGSYLFIGEVVTDLVLEPDSPMQPLECCNCQRCLQICPAGALQPDGSVQLDLCRSHITQKKGELTPWEIQQIQQGGLIWGCDLCNDVCPMNQGVPLTPVPEFLSSVIPVFDSENAVELLKERAFGYRGKKTILRNLSILEEEQKEDEG